MVQGERRGRQCRQVLVVAVGSAVAQVQPAGPGRAAQRQRPRRDPQSRQTLGFTAKSLKLSMVFFFSFCAGVPGVCVAPLRVCKYDPNVTY